MLRMVIDSRFFSADGDEVSRKWPDIYVPKFVDDDHNLMMVRSKLLTWSRIFEHGKLSSPFLGDRWSWRKFTTRSTGCVAKSLHRIYCNVDGTTYQCIIARRRFGNHSIFFYIHEYVLIKSPLNMDIPKSKNGGTSIRYSSDTDAGCVVARYILPEPEDFLLRKSSELGDSLRPRTLRVELTSQRVL